MLPRGVEGTKVAGEAGMTHVLAELAALSSISGTLGTGDLILGRCRNGDDGTC